MPTCVEVPVMYGAKERTTQVITRDLDVPRTIVDYHGTIVHNIELVGDVRTFTYIANR
jgi:hypothetical protein